MIAKEELHLDEVNKMLRRPEAIESFKEAYQALAHDAPGVSADHI